MNIAGNQAVIAPAGVFIIGTYDENGTPNAMNAAWGVQSSFDEITFFLSKHKTTENVQKKGAFTVAFGTVNTLTICDYFGVESGRKVNKIEKSGIKVHRAEHVDAPVLEAFPVTLECKVRSYDPETGVLVGEVVNELVDNSVLTEGKIDLEKLQPITFDSASGSYRTVGPIAGKAFSAGLEIKNDTHEW